MSHVIPPLEELKRRVYCKFHNTFSHTTNDCNMLRRQIQSVVNEGRIIVPQIKVDQNPFSAHTHMLELNNPKVLIWPNQTESTKRKNVITGEERPEKKVLQNKDSWAAAKISTLGAHGNKKDARSAETGLPGLETDLTGSSGNSAKNPSEKRKARPSFKELLAKYEKEGAV